MKGLKELTGVQSGVDQFDAWATKQGFLVERFEDLEGRPVELAPVTAWVRAAVDTGDVERLFVYFAGHGIIRGRGEEYWLLTGAGEGIDIEAVNVAKSVGEAFECGIPHIALFADACRSPASQDLSHVSGGSLFPSKRQIDVDVELDEFYAAQFGDPAYEVVGEAEGIFSRHLFRALRGEVAEALASIPSGREPQAVLARGLKDVLSRNVRIAAGQLGRSQRPWCRPGSYWEPNVLAWIPSVGPSTGEPPRKGSADDIEYWSAVRALTPTDTAGVPTVPPDASERVPPDADAARIAAHDLEVSDAAEAYQLSLLYQGSEGRSHFETGMGLTVVGGLADKGMLGDGEAALFEEGNAWHLRGRGEAEGALVRLAGARVDEWGGTVLLPGYVGVLTVTPTGSETKLAASSIDHVAYLPQSPTSIPADRVARIIADVTARMRIGSFDVDQLDWVANEALLTDLNPSLAVLVAAEWARDGKRGEVRDLLAAFERADRPVPFDLPLLAGRDWAHVDVPVVPAFPLLTGVWALLDSLPAGDDAFNEVRRRLTPALWTSFHDLPAELAQVLAEPTTTTTRLTVGV